MNIKQFDEGNYYISTGNGEKWSDYDGPFSTDVEACAHMGELCGEYATPEMVNSAVLCFFHKGQLGLVRSDSGDVINGGMLRSGTTVYRNQQRIWEPAQSS